MSKEAPRGTLNAEDQARLVRAAEYAHRWHATQIRNQTEIPYVSHLIQVAGLVLEHGGDADQAIAGFLHDALEDAPDTAERAHRKQRIAEVFGPGVLEIVEDCTDTEDDESPEDKREWHDRKRRYLAHLATAPDRSRLVAACDKRHNLHAIVWDVKTHGDAVFDRFKSEPEDQVWYFNGILETLRDSIPPRLGDELADLLETLRGIVASRRP